MAERLCETDLWKTQQGTVCSITNTYSLACSFQLGDLVRHNRDFLVSEQSVINANLVKKFAEK